MTVTKKKNQRLLTIRKADGGSHTGHRTEGDSRELFDEKSLEKVGDLNASSDQDCISYGKVITC